MSKQTCRAAQTCTTALERGNVIASGGYGKVIAYKSLALKLIRRATTCADARKEFLVMRRVYVAFERVRDRECTTDVRAALRRLQPLRPLYFWSEAFPYKGEAFSCGIVTRLAPGMPTEKLAAIFPALVSAEAVRLFPRIMVLPSLSDATGLSLMNASLPVSEANPPRYFVLNVADAAQVYAPSVCNFHTDFPFAMGVLLAIMTCVVKFVMHDVEVLMGDVSDPCIYIMDFGMMTPLLGKTPRDMGAEVADLTTPFMTKQVFPSSESDVQMAPFISGFNTTALLLGVKPEVINEVVDGMKTQFF